MFQWELQTVPSTGSPESAMARLVSATSMPGDCGSTPAKPAAFAILNFSVSVPFVRIMPTLSVFRRRPRIG